MVRRGLLLLEKLLKQLDRKVAIILEELNVPYETKLMDFSELKQDPFESINPNGRVPAIEDPNTGMKLWESGAIIEYLLETYDKEGKLSYAKGPEKWDTKAWLHFQTSGQGQSQSYLPYKRIGEERRPNR